MIGDPDTLIDEATSLIKKHGTKINYRGIGNNCLEWEEAQAKWMNKQAMLPENRQWCNKVWMLVVNQHEIIKRQRRSVRDLSSKVVECQDTVIRLQEKVITQKEDLLSNIQDTVQHSVASSVQSEFKSYSSVASLSSAAPAISTVVIKKVVRGVRDEEDRSRNCMIFGLPEAESDSEDLEGKATEVLESIGEKPRVMEICRVGKKGSGTRKVRLSLSSSAVVGQVLSKANLLREVSRFSGVYFSPDRSREERVERKKLVDELKRRKEAEPKTRHFIRGGEVFTESDT